MKFLQALLVTAFLCFPLAVSAEEDEEPCEKNKTVLEAAAEVLEHIPNTQFVDYWELEDLKRFMTSFFKAFLPTLNPENFDSVVAAASLYLTLTPSTTVVIRNTRVHRITLLSKNGKDPCQFAKFWMPESAFNLTLRYIDIIFREV